MMGDKKISQDPVHRVLLLSAGASHTVALLSDNVECSWGRGEDGQLGHGDADERHEPTIITSLNDCEITSITCGADHTTAYTKDKNIVWSWGWGDFGRLGHGNSSDLFIPQPIKALSGLTISQIACGDCHCLAIAGDGEVYSWGRNQNGQLGLGTNEDASTPQKVSAFEGVKVKMLAAGAEHTAAVTDEGRLYGWGWGRYGNLGLGDQKDRLVPEEVTSVKGEKMLMVACGWRHTICVGESGALYTYGWSKYGQLGHGDFADHLVPATVEALKGHKIKQIAGGWRHTVALDSEGRIFAWGWNKFGQVGVGTNEDQNSPQLISTIQEKVSSVTCGWRHTVAITEAANVYSWGRGTSGQLGHGDTLDRSLPKLVESLSADAGGCRNLQKSAAPSTNASNWISPSERYAVVPDEQAAPKLQFFGGRVEDASVPNAEIKRVRTK